mmetsp:Transcript_13771/g.29812  ORF Transcript_13771/g.29812 Transcript_13771/m.29812 type:complete len:88 (-) Transcript_13771:326-589(-)
MCILATADVIVHICAPTMWLRFVDGSARHQNAGGKHHINRGGCYSSRMLISAAMPQHVVLDLCDISRNASAWTESLLLANTCVPFGY